MIQRGSAHIILEEMVNHKETPKVFQINMRVQMNA